MENKEVIEKIREEAKQYFENVNPCHDFLHTERVLNLALRIGKKEDVNLEIVELSALFHDIAREDEDKSKGKICHAEKGAEMAKKILKKYGYNEDIINNIAHCIETHRFRNNKNPESKEAKVLSDADKLDAIGAIGVGRAFSFAGHIGAKVHIPDIDVKRTKGYTKDDCAYREFLIKLNKIKDKMLTEEGKKIAEERHVFMLRFFEQLNKEAKGEA